MVARRSYKLRLSETGELNAAAGSSSGTMSTGTFLIVLRCELFFKVGPPFLKDEILKRAIQVYEFYGGGCDESVGKRKAFSFLLARSTHDDSADRAGLYCGFVVIA